MKQMTKLENIIMNRSGCNRETANLIANDILQEVEKDLQAEVAREIFEKIERKVKASIVVHLEEINKEHIQDTPLYDRHSGIVFALRGMEDFIAELKKKYTEEQI